MSIQIPTALIHQLQSTLRDETAFATASSPPPPFLSVADAIAAFDSSSSTSSSPPLRCKHCGGAGGLLRGAHSAVCVYCGAPHRSLRSSGGEEEEEEIAAATAFGTTAACSWLLGSLGLDGSEPVNFDTEPAESSKGKDTPKNGLVLSDLLDIKLTWPHENKESSETFTNKEWPSVTYALNLSSVDLDSFFTEAKTEVPSVNAFPCSDPIIQKKQSTNSKSHGSSSSEMYIPSEGFYSSGMKTSNLSTDYKESTQSFANWDANFQSAGSEEIVQNPKPVDLFQSSSAAEPFTPPIARPTIDKITSTENEMKMKGTSLEFSEDFGKPLSSEKFVQDDPFGEKNAQPESGSGSEMTSIDGNSSSLLNKSSLDKKSVEGDPWLISTMVSVNTGNNIDEAFDDWQEFTTAGGNKENSSNSREIEGPWFSDHSGVHSVAINMKVSDDVKPGDGNDDSFDDWQAFASSSGMKQTGETASMSLEHSAETKSVDLRPTDMEESNNMTLMNENNDSFDDWQDFTSSGQALGTLCNSVGDMMSISYEHPTEAKSMDSLLTDDTKESNNAKLVNGVDDSFDVWKGFTRSGLAQGSSSNLGGDMMSTLFEHPKDNKSMDSWLPGNVKEPNNAESVNGNNDSFDVWSDFTGSSHAQESSSNIRAETRNISFEHPEKTNSMDLWLTSNIEEPNRNVVMHGNNFSSDGLRDCTSSNQAQESSTIPGGEMPNSTIENPSETGSLSLWGPSRMKEFSNIEPMNENQDSLDDWQDFTSSDPPKRSLPTLSDSPSFEYPSVSKPNVLQDMEFGSFSSSKVPGEKQSSNEATEVPLDAHSDRTNGAHQMAGIDSLSTVWKTTGFEDNSTSKREPSNTNVDNLLSQMHDLSFMLKDELWIPNKPVNPHPK